MLTHDELIVADHLLPKRRIAQCELSGRLVGPWHDLGPLIDVVVGAGIRVLLATERIPAPLTRIAWMAALPGHRAVFGDHVVDVTPEHVHPYKRQ
ncbi:hypothetical protein ACFQ08_09505 [Streptosporangium algeriense]|uniref:Uncharacterized protein n=1 Tax=Streptosporangium algeriense TaxID=1682748 RepID=A0ABW3DQ57_9ACTN